MTKDPAAGLSASDGGKTPLAPAALAVGLILASNALAFRSRITRIASSLVSLFSGLFAHASQLHVGEQNILAAKHWQ